MNFKIILYQDVLKRIVSSNKTYYDHISKYGKSVAKELISIPEYEEPMFKDFTLEKPVLNKTIAEHMYRSGYFESAEAFSEEAKVEVEIDSGDSNSDFQNHEFKEKFRLLNRVISEFRDSKEIKLGLEWAKENAK